MNDNLTITKGPWNKLEDERLSREVEKYKSLYPNQQISWKYIEEVIENRTSKQCRERWTNHLYNVNKSPLTAEEESYIIQMRKDDPNIPYVQIAEKLPGRTPLIIKNFIYRERIKERKSILRIRQMMSVKYINN
ncbi:hypothetical protein RclHR1_08690012 [Rhizophagus clarus]|uniref:Myb-like transcription factor n=1 Tax=Rhizophagus clarus TaxID=94130 RepID=A0A2Z6SNX4_9GLOM|nr:hypothetical protein RclHR1_08690012 [Rhizophagus clarus]GES89079.1 Myb-like transcription factor [Rhizophagus clarus]